MTHPAFDLLQDRQVAEINSRVRLYRHAKTGAVLMSVENDDENKVFGIAFATPPDDSTGLPHILEHSVLCGSRSYPVKEPFNVLRRGSLNTFLNAMTWPDRTVYPVASQNRADFYNLVQVYLDAVFKPLLTPETLQTQGWHYEADDIQSPLAYRGVVFNEMKGAYSSPDSLVGRFVQQSLFPDNIYGFDSGGDPAVIPDLSYQQFMRFYRRYYHPSNSFLFFYGDDHSDARLDMAAAYLDDYEAAPAAPPAALQPRFSAPRRFSYPYDAGQDDSTQDPARSYVTVNWLLNEVTERNTTFALEVLSHILINTQASPLRKALIDSGLGEGLIGYGYDAGYREAAFSTGLRGVTPAAATQVEPLVLATLEQIVRHGIDPEMTTAALNTLEFRLREANTGSYPRGLMYMLAALGGWLYGSDPIGEIAYEAPLQQLRQVMAADARFFEGLIQHYLLDNPHRTVVQLDPDPTLRARTEAAERARLDAERAAMSLPELQAIQHTMQHLRQLQETPDSPAALATIPSLAVDDLAREIRHIPVQQQAGGPARLITHDLFTNGIVYLDLGFDLRTLPQHLLPYGELFGRLLLSMGTTTQDFVRISQRIGRDTGGIFRAAHTGITRSRQPLAYLFLRGKATASQGQALLDILRDLLLDVQLDNRDRLRQIVLQEKAGLESGLIPGGHMVVYRRLRARFTLADWAGEQIGGVAYLFFIRRLLERIESDWPAVLAELHEVQRCLVQQNGLLANVTASAADLTAFLPRLQKTLAALPAQSVPAALWQPEPTAHAEGLTSPAQVNYVGKAANLYDYGYTRHGSTQVAVKLLDNSWIWDRIRVQGGAYGGFCTFNSYSGVLAFLSYRDPNVLSTLQAYDGAADFLRRVEWSQSDVDKTIIGVIGQMDSYELPDAKGYTALLRTLNGDTDALRQQVRDEVLATTLADVRALATWLDEVAAHGAVVALGSEAALRQADQTLPQPLHITRVL